MEKGVDFIALGMSSEKNFCSFPSVFIYFDLIIALIKALLFLKLYFVDVVVVVLLLGKPFQLLKIIHFPQYCTCTKYKYKR